MFGRRKKKNSVWWNTWVVGKKSVSDRGGKIIYRRMEKCF